METKKIRKRVTEAREEEQTIYVAADGREFHNEQKCREHEQAYEAVSVLRAEDLGRPIDCDYNDDWDFVWYKVNSMDDMTTLERYYEKRLSRADCQDAVKDGLVCIAEPYLSAYDEPGIFTINEMIRLVTNFMDAAGYTVEIRKKN